MSVLKELFDADAVRDDAVYGLCPKCGAKGIMRERRTVKDGQGQARPDGNDVCAEGCRFPSRDAVAPLRDVHLKDKES